jgi:hypothetical protein
MIPKIRVKSGVGREAFLLQEFWSQRLASAHTDVDIVCRNNAVVKAHALVLRQVSELAVDLIKVRVMAAMFCK